MSRTEEKEKRKNKVREMYTLKVSERDIAKEMEISISTVRNYLSEMGLFSERRKDDTREKLYAQIVEMYSAGMELKDMVKELGVNKAYICGVIRRKGIPRRKKFLAVEENLINENTVFADNRPPILERLSIDGKRYTDITQVILRR